MIISFKFSVFELEIGHKFLKELGEFTIFCMKAISNDMNVKDISNIIQIKKKIIKNQLSFAISRKYLTDDFYLTEKGIEIVGLFEFINIFNQNKIKIALEHYIENNSKRLYLVNNKKLVGACSGYLVKDNLFDYKIKHKFDEIIEKDRNKIKSLILNDFEKYKDTIEKYLDNFIFKIKKTEDKIFYNHSINIDNLISLLSTEKEKNSNYISIDIPVLEVKKTITNEIMDKKYIDLIQLDFDKIKYFNLINGDPIQLKIKNKKSNYNMRVEPIIKKIDIIKNTSDSKKISINDFLYVDMNTRIKEFYETRFLDITGIMDNI